MRSWRVWPAVLFLAACAAPQPGVSPGLGPPVPRFAAEGRISLRQGEHSDHLRFRWEHTPERDALLLMSPLGQGLAELTRDATGARLVQANRAPISADNLPQLARRVVGAPLPLEALADWLRGARAELGGEADGWQVMVSDSSAFGQRRLVRVLEARRGDVDLKLVIDDWDLPE